MRILVPLDGSDLAEGALDIARSFAEAFGGEVILFTVADESQSVDDARDARAEIDDQHTRAKQRLGDVPVEQRIDTSGEAAAGILAAAVELDIDHIVMTTHGRSGLNRLAQGSVAEEVLRNAVVPITLVRPEAEGER